jgi:L-2-hydroxyglutarate oxidase LhgO
VSDPLLGWTTVGERQFYVRQFRNMKGTVALDGIDAPALTDYAGICGQLLAKGHARTSGASMIAGYLGKSDRADRALGRFARAYADQTERDHEALVAAVRRGKLAAETGV